MSLLTGEEIIRLQRQGVLTIDPFHLDHVNPNSYDLTLSPQLMTYESPPYDISSRGPIDLRNAPCTVIHDIPEGGLVIKKGELYLGLTNERCGSDEYVPCIEGKSSIARYGVEIHMTGGFGDLGFKSKWVLEIMSHRFDFLLLPNMKIAQCIFQTTVGSKGILYKGKYQNQERIIPSRSHMDFKVDRS